MGIQECVWGVWHCFNFEAFLPIENSLLDRPHRIGALIFSVGGRTKYTWPLATWQGHPSRLQGSVSEYIVLWQVFYYTAARYVFPHSYFHAMKATRFVNVKQISCDGFCVVLLVPWKKQTHFVDLKFVLLGTAGVCSVQLYKTLNWKKERPSSVHLAIFTHVLLRSISILFASNESQECFVTLKHGALWNCSDLGLKMQYHLTSVNRRRKLLLLNECHSSWLTRKSSRRQINGNLLPPFECTPCVHSTSKGVNFSGIQMWDDARQEYWMILEQIGSSHAHCSDCVLWFVAYFLCTHVCKLLIPCVHELCMSALPCVPVVQTTVSPLAGRRAGYQQKFVER